MRYEKDESSQKTNTPQDIPEEIHKAADPEVICAPLDGELIPMEEIPDETFASGVLGPCVGIRPESGSVYAPFAGTISIVAETGHAIGITGEDGTELLIHVGVDTVQMNGKGFAPKVKEGEKVEGGQKLLEFDKKAIKDAGYSDVAVVIATNADRLEHVKTSMVRMGEEIFRTGQKGDGNGLS